MKQNWKKSSIFSLLIKYNHFKNKSENQCYLKTLTRIILLLSIAELKVGSFDKHRFVKDNIQNLCKSIETFTQNHEHRLEHKSFA